MSLDTVLSAAVVRPVTLGFLDFKDDPRRGWDGPGTLAPVGTGYPDLDGETFEQSSGAVEISDILEDLGIGSQITITFSAGEMDDEDIVLQLVADRRAFLGRKARFWRGFLLADDSAIMSEIDPLFYGVMVSAETHREPGQPATISITCDQDTQKARVAPRRWLDHQLFYPGDTASSFIIDLSRGPISGANHAVVAPPNGRANGGYTSPIASRIGTGRRGPRGS